MHCGQLLDTFSKALTALAIVVGGGWVLFNYFVGRTHRPRVQLRISGERILRDGLEYLLIKTELSNVGVARVKLVNDGCVTKIFEPALPKPTRQVMEPIWEKVAAIDLFIGQRWVEPNGLLIDQQLIAIPGLHGKFLKIWGHVESKNVAWNAEAVIAPRAEVAGSALV